MPGAGKSTVGVLLSKRLALDFVDSDLAIQVREGRTLQQIIDAGGHLRLRETSTCASTAATTPTASPQCRSVPGIGPSISDSGSGAVEGLFRLAGSRSGPSTR